MNEAFDPFNLLILGIAIVIFWRLRNALGRRTGHERKPFDPFNAPDTNEGAGAETGNTGNVVTLPGAKTEEARLDQQLDDDEPPVWQGHAEDGTPLAEALATIAASDQSFQPTTFLEGGRMAYEMIVTAFDAGDRRTLKTLLSKEVLEAFETAINDRESNGSTIESNFVGIDNATIIDASVKSGNANVTVKIVSQLISATFDRDGNIIDGDPKKVREVTDIWTFMRELESNDPNWKLIATEAAN